MSAVLKTTLTFASSHAHWLARQSMTRKERDAFDYAVAVARIVRRVGPKFFGKRELRELVERMRYLRIQSDGPILTRQPGSPVAYVKEMRKYRQSLAADRARHIAYYTHGSGPGFRMWPEEYLELCADRSLNTNGERISPAPQSCGPRLL